MAAHSLRQLDEPWLHQEGDLDDVWLRALPLCRGCHNLPHADSSTLVHKATVLQSEADSGGARHAHVVRTWELCEKQCTLRGFVIAVG